MGTTLTAIETRYKGYRFRSRLEARWAVFFDALGVVWEYEKEGFDLGEAGWYLPDFYLPAFDMWVEVKPSVNQTPDMHIILEAFQEILRRTSWERKENTHWLGGESGWHDGIHTPTVAIADESFTIHLQRPKLVLAGAGYRLFESSAWIGGENLVCMACNNEHVHLVGFENCPERHEGRTGVALNFRCEDGCAFSVQISNDQGIGFMRMFRAFRPTHYFPSILASELHISSEEQRQRYEVAVASARAARFEHGETPC